MIRSVKTATTAIGMVIYKRFWTSSFLFAMKGDINMLLWYFKLSKKTPCIQRNNNNEEDDLSEDMSTKLIE